MTHRFFLSELTQTIFKDENLNNSTQSLAVFLIINMDFTVREEIIIFTSIFCFCMFTIPIILIDAASNKTHQMTKTVNKNFNELEFRQKLLIDSIIVLESVNRHENNSLTFFNLLNITESDFNKKYPNVLPKNNFHPRFQRKLSKTIWKKFNFVNGTILRSQSLRLPLSIDW